jgi:hypothetical protein
VPDDFTLNMNSIVCPLVRTTLSNTFGRLPGGFSRLYWLWLFTLLTIEWII